MNTYITTIYFYHKHFLPFIKNATWSPLTLINSNTNIKIQKEKPFNILQQISCSQFSFLYQLLKEKEERFFSKKGRKKKKKRQNASQLILELSNADPDHTS